MGSPHTKLKSPPQWGGDFSAIVMDGGGVVRKVIAEGEWAVAETKKRRSKKRRSGENRTRANPKQKKKGKAPN